jgi:phage tail-like protein
MARYGTDIYGIGRYGAGVLALVDFDATPFTAEPANYGSIKLSWATPTGDWTSLRLVRNRYGFPVAADDGDILVDSAKENAPTEYRDKGQTPENRGLVQGIVYFYSIFVYSTQQSFWVKAGNASSISPKEFHGGNDLFSLMPAIYQSDTYKTLTGSADNEDLKSFLSIFETYFDFCKTYAELVKNLYDPSKTPIQLLPALLNQFGLQYEPEIGVQQTRILLKNAALINKKKGSLQGIEDFVKSFTGWDSVVVPTKNIMLNYNDSSFEESVGSWENIAKAELSVVESGVVLPYESTVLTGLGFPNKQSGSLKVKATIAGDVIFACGISSPKTRGIPVKPSTLYVFSIFSKAATTARTVTADIIWYDKDMNEISRAGEEAKQNAVGNWVTRVESSSSSPANAWFAVPYLRIDGAALDEVHYFDAGQFEESNEGATYFSEARGVDITLKANRINLITNPCFEDTLTPWVATGATLSIDTGLTETATGSVGSAKIEYTGGTEVTVDYDNFISVVPEEWYTLSGYIRTAYTGAYEQDYLGNFNIDWYDYSQTLISTTNEPPTNLTEFYNVVSLYRTNGILYLKTDELTSVLPGEEIRLVHFEFDTIDANKDPITYDLDGTYTVLAVVENEMQIQISGDNIPLLTVQDLPSFPLIQDLKLNFNRVSMTELSPENARFAKVRFEWKNPVATKSIWLDSVLMERSSSEGSFFDGSRGFSDSSDLVWEGTVNHSRSHYYKNRVAVEKRLIATLPKYLPIGTTFTLKLATEDSF